MSLDLDHTTLGPLLPRLSPYGRSSLLAAGERALRLHSDEVTPEHWLGAIVADEDSGAHQLAIHAFADPETIDLELLALSPGIMVVGSKAALPFSPAAVRALQRARQAGLAAGAGSIELDSLLSYCIEELAEPAAEALRQAGYSPITDASPRAAGPEETALAADGPLFRGFSDPAKRALSQANKDAFGAKETAISPARLAVACLALDPELESRCGIRRVQAVAALRGQFADLESLAPRALPPSDELLGFLDGLQEGAGSIAVLAATREQGDAELIALLDRHKITESLLARSLEAFRDPEHPEPRTAQR